MNEIIMALISGWIVFYFAVFLPGPNTFFVASVGISGQKKQIWGAAVGTAVGSFTWCLSVSYTHLTLPTSTHV